MEHAVRVDQRDDQERKILAQSFGPFVLGHNKVQKALKGEGGGGLSGVHSAGDHHVGLLELLGAAFHLEVGEEGLGDPGFVLLQHVLLTGDGEQADRASFQALDEQFAGHVNLLFLLEVVAGDSFPEILQEELVPLERVGIVVG